MIPGRQIWLPLLPLGLDKYRENQQQNPDRASDFAIQGLRSIPRGYLLRITVRASRIWSYTLQRRALDSIEVGLIRENGTLENMMPYNGTHATLDPEETGSRGAIKISCVYAPCARDRNNQLRVTRIVSYPIQRGRGIFRLGRYALGIYLLHWIFQRFGAKAVPHGEIVTQPRTIYKIGTTGEVYNMVYSVLPHVEHAVSVPVNLRATTTSTPSGQSPITFKFPQCNQTLPQKLVVFHSLIRCALYNY